MKKKILQIALAILFLYNVDLFSQWSNNPGVNLLIGGGPGEQALPKIANAGNGSTYVSWFGNQSGRYYVYLQRLNSMGIPELGSGGMLVSNNPQSSSLVDYDMIVDDDDNAIIVFTDTRNGPNINPFIYKISPQGNFLWGANGISLANDINTYQANPKLAKTSDNGVVVTWIYSSTPNKIAFQKISPNGTKLWSPDPIYLSGSGTENYTYPSLVSSDNGSVIALWSGYTGSFINPGNYKLYTQKFSSTGSVIWQDTVYNLGNVTGFFVPKIFSDGNDGALYIWQDDRNSVNLQSSYVQHYSSSGTRIFPLNGSEGSTEAGFNKFDAWAAYMPSTNETYLVWKGANSLQSQFAIFGQRFSIDGNRLWTDNAMEFTSFDADSYVNQVCFTYDTNMVVVFNQSTFGSVNNTHKAFRTGRNGILGWTGSIIDVSNVPSEKSKISATMTSQGMTKVAWSDDRSGAADVYAQNINSNGTLGNSAVNVNNIYGASGFALSQNYPNPFNPATVISYQLATNNFVTLKIFNMLGKEIATLVNEKQNSGIYTVSFDGNKQSSGIYFYTLNAGDFKETKSMILVK